MTVKIVDPNPSPEVIKYCNCGNCGVKLSYVPMDVQSYIHYDYGGGSDRIDYINCPGCSSKVTVRHY